MSQKTPVVNFVQVRGWYIPADAESYALLKSINAPLCKVHSSMLPVLELSMRPKKIRAKSVSFADTILAPHLDKLGEIWLSKEGRKCKLGDSQLVFTAPLTSANKKAINNLDGNLTRFFARWGFSYCPIYSDDGSKRCKLVVDFKFNNELNPIIPTVDPSEQKPVEFELGFTKLRITYGQQRVAYEFGKQGSWQNEPRTVGAPFHLLEVFVKTGTSWSLVHSGTFIDATIGEADSWLSCMFELAGKRKQQE